jgi:hypothetical protein
MAGPAPRGRRARASALLFSAVPRENLIEDDGAERCGADPSHREGAELKGEVAGPRRKRHPVADRRAPDATRAGMRGAWSDLRQATAAEEVRLDAGKSARLPSRRSRPAAFDRLLRT